MTGLRSDSGLAAAIDALESCRYPVTDAQKAVLDTLRAFADGADAFQLTVQDASSRFVRELLSALERRYPAVVARCRSEAEILLGTYYEELHQAVVTLLGRLPSLNKRLDASRTAHAKAVEAELPVIRSAREKSEKDLQAEMGASSAAGNGEGDDSVEDRLRRLLELLRSRGFHSVPSSGQQYASTSSSQSSAPPSARERTAAAQQQLLQAAEAALVPSEHRQAAATIVAAVEGQMQQQRAAMEAVLLAKQQAQAIAASAAPSSAPDAARQEALSVAADLPAAMQQHLLGDIDEESRIVAAALEAEQQRQKQLMEQTLQQAKEEHLAKAIRIAEAVSTANDPAAVAQARLRQQHDAEQNSVVSSLEAEAAVEHQRLAEEQAAQAAAAGVDPPSLLLGRHPLLVPEVDVEGTIAKLHAARREEKRARLLALQAEQRRQKAKMEVALEERRAAKLRELRCKQQAELEALGGNAAPATVAKHHQEELKQLEEACAAEAQQATDDLTALVVSRAAAAGAGVIQASQQAPRLSSFLPEIDIEAALARIHESHREEEWARLLALQAEQRRQRAKLEQRLAEKKEAKLQEVKRRQQLEMEAAAVKAATSPVPAQPLVPFPQHVQSLVADALSRVELMNNTLGSDVSSGGSTGIGSSIITAEVASQRLAQKQADELAAAQALEAAAAADEANRKEQEAEAQRQAALQARKDAFSARLASASASASGPDEIARLQAEHEADMAQLERSMGVEKARQQQKLAQQLEARRVKKLRELQRKQEAEKEAHAAAAAAQDQARAAEEAVLREKAAVQAAIAASSTPTSPSASGGGTPAASKLDAGQVLEGVMSQRHMKEAADLLARQYGERATALQRVMVAFFDKRREAKAELLRQLAADGVSDDNISAAVVQFDAATATERGACEKSALDDLEGVHAEQQLALKQRQLSELASAMTELAPEDTIRRKEAENAAAEAARLRSVQEQLQKDKVERLAAFQRERRELEERVRREAEEELHCLEAEHASHLEAERKRADEQMALRRERLLKEAEAEKARKLKESEGLDVAAKDAIIREFEEDCARADAKLRSIRAAQLAKTEKQLEQRRLAKQRKQEAEAAQRLRKQQAKLEAEQQVAKEQAARAAEAETERVQQERAQTAAAAAAFVADAVATPGGSLLDAVKKTAALQATLLQRQASTSNISNLASAADTPSSDLLARLAAIEALVKQLSSAQQQQQSQGVTTVLSPAPAAPPPFSQSLVNNYVSPLKAKTSRRNILLPESPAGQPAHASSSLAAGRSKWTSVRALTRLMSKGAAGASGAGDSPADDAPSASRRLLLQLSSSTRNLHTIGAHGGSGGPGSAFGSITPFGGATLATSGSTPSAAAAAGGGGPPLLRRQISHRMATGSLSERLVELRRLREPSALRSYLQQLESSALSEQVEEDSAEASASVDGQQVSTDPYVAPVGRDSGLLPGQEGEGRLPSSGLLQSGMRRASTADSTGAGGQGRLHKRLSALQEAVDKSDKLYLQRTAAQDEAAARVDEVEASMSEVKVRLRRARRAAHASDALASGAGGGASAELSDDDVVSDEDEDEDEEDDSPIAASIPALESQLAALGSSLAAATAEQERAASAMASLSAWIDSLNAQKRALQDEIDGIPALDTAERSAAAAAIK